MYFVFVITFTSADEAFHLIVLGILRKGETLKLRIFIILVYGTMLLALTARDWRGRY